MNQRHPTAPDDRVLAPLFSPFLLRSLNLRNRIVVSPMQMYSAQDGVVNDWHLVHLGRYALGGAGMIVMEATAVCPEGRSTLHDNGLWSDSQIAGYRRITDFLRANGCASAIQLQHAGRKASSQAPWHGFGPLESSDAARGERPWQAWGPDNRGWSPKHSNTHAITTADIPYILDAYRDAARRALDSEFDAIEIHAAHGYLLHSFLSPLSNGRQDDYGGDLAGRMRLPIEVAQAVREVWPQDKPLLFRISCVDGKDIGWSMQDSVVLAKQLKGIGVDVIDCSSGGMNLPSRDDFVPRQPGFQVPFAAEIRSQANVATMAVGLIQDANQANEIVQNGEADLVALARELLWNPNWPLHAAQTLEVDSNFEQWPHQYGWWLARRSRALQRQ